MKKLFVFLIVSISVMLFGPCAFAEHLFGPDELDTTYGATIQFRHETWDNVFNMDDDIEPDDGNLVRFKTSVWMKNEYDNKWGLY